MTENIEMSEKVDEKSLKSRLNDVKNNKRVLFKIFILFLCFIGLCFQLEELFAQFFDRQTVVNSKIEDNNVDAIPAITICYPFSLSMERVAQKYPDLRPKFEEYKNSLKNESEFDNKNTTNNNTDFNRLYTEDFVKYIEEQNLMATQLFELSIPFLNSDEAFSKQNEQEYSVQITAIGVVRYPDKTIKNF